MMNHRSERHVRPTWAHSRNVRQNFKEVALGTHHWEDGHGTDVAACYR